MSIERKARAIIIFISFIGFFIYLATLIKNPTEISMNGNFYISYVHRDEQPEKKDKLIQVKSSSPIGAEEVTLNLRKEKGFETFTMTQLQGTDYYFYNLKGKPKGERTYFFFKAKDREGKEIILPKNAPKNLYFIKHEGSVSKVGTLFHITLMMTALFILIHSLYFSLLHLFGDDKNETISKMTNSVLIALVVFFITGFPIGWWIAYEVYGKAWTGIPFGMDITDNKTLIILIYWLLALLVYKFKKIDSKLFAKLVILGAIFTLILFLIPHSI
ncbi:MAG: hypothetical protein AB1410_06745 [Acidobacteriota bacterium]